MEEVDIEQWLALYSQQEVRYAASYNPETGELTKISNAESLIAEQYTVDIDTELAEKLIEGKLPVHKCYIDFDTMTVEIAETKTVNKINDVLHRVIELEHSQAKKNDVYITYSRIDKMLSIELIDINQFVEISNGETVKKRIPWDPSTILSFYLTDYNDPNVIYQTVKITIAELVATPQTMSSIELPERFSIFTKRLFKHYVLEIK